jgi:glycosyltransferase involved in cell wall biosynthesis
MGLIKIAMLGSYPAASVLPPELVRAKNRTGNHPAPWIGAMAPALARMGGFELRVFVIQRAVLKHRVVEQNGVCFECIPFPFPERFNVYHRYALQSWMLRQHVTRYAPDIVHAFGMETGCATMAIRLGLPVSCFIQGIVERYAPYLSHVPRSQLRILGAMERRAVTRVGWMVAETQFARDWAKDHNPEAQIAIIPHALRQNFVTRGAARFGRHVVTVGGMDERKGMNTVLSAFARMADRSARLCMVGRGPQKDSLHRQAVELGVAGRVEFAGALDTDGVIAKLNESSVFVIGSRMDTSPNVVTEAHAVGLPVVGTRAGGIPEMIDEGRDGFLVDVDDAPAMAERMDRLLSRPDEARALGAAGREKVRRLNDPDAVASAHADFFRRMVAAKGRQG